MASSGLTSAHEATRLVGYENLQKRLAAIKGPVLGAGVMRALAKQAVGEQKQLMYQRVQRKTGQAGRQIVLGAVTATEAATIAHNYTVFLDRGTKAHDIRPRNKSVLRWPTSSAGLRLSGRPSKGYKGGFAFAKVVHHPGTRAYDFMVPGARLAITRAKLLDRVVAAWNEAA